MRLKICVIMLLVAGTVSAWGAPPVVREIEVLHDGMGKSDPEYVKAHTRIRVGHDLSSAAISRDVKILLSTGQFSDVKASVEEMDDGAKLILRVTPKLRLAEKPRIRGVEKYRIRKVRRWLELEVGDLIDDQAVGVAVRKVLKEYREDLYSEATAKWTLDPVDKKVGTVKLSIKFDEGDIIYIENIEVVGNKTIPTGDLRDALKRPSPFNPLSWFRKKRYEYYQLADIEAGVRRVYMDHGFLDVKVDVAIAEEQVDQKDVAIVTVDEGDLYQIDEIKFEGISIYPENELRALISLRSGQVASISSIENSARRLQSYYGDRGYLNAGARPLITPNKNDPTVNVKFMIREGNLVSIRNIIIRGNTRTKDKVVRRELIVYPGDVYNQSRVKRSERRVNNLGFFETVRVSPQKTSNEDEKDLVFDVAEKRTGQFMLGAGFSSVDNLMGFIELSQGNFDLLGWPNFTGGGQKLRLRAQVGSERQDYDISFTEPWFLDQRLSLGFNIYSRDRSYDDYDESLTGASISVGKALMGPNRITFRYSLEGSEISGISDTNTYYELDSYDFETDTGTPYEFEDEEDRIKSTLAIGIRHDTRNNPFVPTRGNKVRLFYSLSGGPLGFDTDLYDLGLKSTSYVPLWFGHVLNVRSKFEFVESFEDTEDVPLADKLFLGGGRTLRGFEYREVGPKVVRRIDGTEGISEDPSENYSRSYGGQSLFMLKVEYIVPIVKGVRFATFYDTGNVWSEAYTLDVGDLASSCGFGVRFDMPGFPIRIDRAWVIDYDDEYTEDDKWVIWIGYDN